MILSMYYPVFQNGQCIGYVGAGVYAGHLMDSLLHLEMKGLPDSEYVFLNVDSGVYLYHEDETLLNTETTDAGYQEIIRRIQADGGAQELCRLLCESRPADIAAYFARLESGKTSREELKALLSDARDLLARGLAAGYGAEGGPMARRLARELGPRRISAAADVLQRFIGWCGYNTGVGHLAGALAAELTELR